MRPTGKMSHMRRLTSVVCSLLLLAFAFVAVSTAQEARHRLAPSLTSEDLLDRRAIVVQGPGATRIAPSSATPASTAASTFYLDPAGTYSLSLPSRSWRTSAKTQSPGKFYSHRIFRKVEEEGFASATVNVYVLTDHLYLLVPDATRLGPSEQRELADKLTSRFLSQTVTLRSVTAISTDTGGARLHVVADQIIARRTVVRASIDAFKREGHLFIVVRRAPVESFEGSARDFDAITASLASLTTRS